MTAPNVDTPDARSRHRKSCQQAVINRLQDPTDRDAAAQMLADTWSTHVDSNPASKRLHDPNGRDCASQMLADTWSIHVESNTASKRSRDHTPQAPRRIEFDNGDDFFNADGLDAFLDS